MLMKYAARLLSVMLLLAAAQAFASSSANYTITVSAINNAGPNGASANYNRRSSVGDGVAMPPMTSANYALKPGFQPMAGPGGIAPVITSANSTTFTVNSAGTFTVTATGTPAPTFSITGALPSGVTFAGGVLSGTPALGTVGSYPLTITATNAIPPDATQAFTLTVAKAAQTITFGAQAGQPFTAGAIFALSPVATASSGLAVSYSSTTPTICSISGINVTMIAPGVCTISAAQAGNANYNAAAPVSQNITLTVVPVNQTITFANPGNQPVGALFALNASATSNLPVVFSTLTPSVCTVSGTNASMVAAGTCTIAANQPGNAFFNPAPQVTQSFTVQVLLPNPPLALSCLPGLGRAICAFLPPLPNGTAPVTSYTVTCTSVGSSVAASGSLPPIVVTGLNASTFYTCTATAKNTAGNSLPSNQAFVVPFGLPARNIGIDRNGDGRAELAVRVVANNAGGASQIFSATLDANNKLVFGPIPDPGPTWKVLGAGSLAGAQRSDLLMQDSVTGYVKIWLGFDSSPDNEIVLRVVKPGWVVRAVSDVDGDGNADIVWQYVTPGSPDTGVVFVWFMNGGEISEIKYRGGAPLDWQLVDAADLTGNGNSDMIWVSPTGAIRVISALPGRNYVNQLLGTLPAGYSLARIGDFSGDGRADLLFRDASGRVKLRSMNGLTTLAEINMPATDPSWILYGTGDLNGDGTVDIVWKKPDNSLVLWLMNAAAPGTPTIVDNAGTAPSGSVAIGP
jgi:hypothetical protein